MNDAPPVFRASRYAGSLVAVGALSASITTLIVMLLSRGSVFTSRTSAGGASDPGQLSWLFALVLVPLLTAMGAVVLTWLAIRFIRVMTYQRALRTYCDLELGRAGIHSMRALLPLESVADGASRAGDVRDTDEERAEDNPVGEALRRLMSMRRALLLGPGGAGKSITILALARRLSSPLASARAALGLGRIPALLSLPGLSGALTAGSTMETYIARQIAHFGATGLAARVPRMMRRGGLTLLCDDYDMLDADARELVNTALQAWSETPYGRCQLVIACDSDTFERDLDGPGPLMALPVERLKPLPLSDVTHMLATSQSGIRRRGAAEEYAQVALTRPVGAMLTVPAVARALTDGFGAGQPPAWGYGGLLRQQLLIKSDETPAETPTAPLAPVAPVAPDVALVWGALAASQQTAQVFCMPLDPVLMMGECAARWLSEHAPLMPTSFALQHEQAFDPTALEYGMRLGVQVGVLRRHVDGLGISFAHPVMRKAAAAYWLEAMDNGLGRLNSALLTAEWVAPVTLWASARPDAVDIAQRIYRLSQSPESVATRAGFSRGADVAPAALALALAAAVEGAAPQLIQFASGAATDARQNFTTQQELRDLLDSAAIMAVDATRRRSLIAALRQVSLRVGPSFHANICALITLEQFDRLARAQLTLVLGLIGTPDAMDELLKIFAKTDLTIRQAARQALIYVGVEAIPTLQRLASSDEPATRKRASEALAFVTASTPEATEVAGTAAISGLRSADARQRHVAVTTLSAMRASEALGALVARLDDTSLEVQIAAANALGQLGAPAGLAALRKRAQAEAPALRRAIAEALGASAEPQSLAPLLGLLADRDRTVRAAAAIALGAQGDQRAAGPLREAAQDPDPWVRQAAQAAVRRLTGA